ncbi:MAG: methyl-accepting chemotaxis protein [Blautia sp.]|nr:methyl-accepting chemotaxis protein [Lachnoclostridium sp.]MCM1210420.1 methyl-accepting chemotaxis protein [Blautia sp.]
MNTNVVEEYMNKVYTIVILVGTGACCAGGSTTGVLKLLGFYPTVPWLAIGIFVGSCILYFSIGVWFVTHAYEISEEGGAKRIRHDMMVKGKIFMLIILTIQWNFFVYMLPSRDFWAYAFFFIILIAFFMDVKLTSALSAAIVVSTIVAWIFRADKLLPVKDAYFIPEMVFRIICITLSIAGIILFDFLVEHYLINVKKEELEANNSRVEKVLSKVTSLVADLNDTSVILSEVSQNESASTEELSATSDSLLKTSNAVLQETERSRENMVSLEDCSVELDKNITEVERISRDLLAKSSENEVLLKELQEKNKEVSDSSQNTQKMSEALLGCVDEIGIALKVINDISSSTSLLALNASIEAARAGEAGKGFAVVAESVGGLAANTKESLSDIQEVINKLQSNVREMSTSVEVSTTSLERQNETFEQTFASIEDMMSIIKASLDAITEMNRVHTKQSDIIQTTVSINQEILEAVQSESEQFINISEMINDNSSNIIKMTAQAEQLESMIGDLKATLL